MYLKIKNNSNGQGLSGAPLDFRQISRKYSCPLYSIFYRQSPWSASDGTVGLVLGPSSASRRHQVLRALFCPERQPSTSLPCSRSPSAGGGQALSSMCVSFLRCWQRVYRVKLMNSCCPWGLAFDQGVCPLKRALMLADILNNVLVLLKIYMKNSNLCL